MGERRGGERPPRARPPRDRLHGHSRAPPPPAGRRRGPGDRGLGMVMVHFGPNPRPQTPLGDLYGVSHGRASVLFALLAGVGVVLLVGDRSRGRSSLIRGRLVLRGALLLPLGLWLQELDHGALVILQY